MKEIFSHCLVLLLMLLLPSAPSLAQKKTQQGITIEAKNESMASVFKRLESVSPYKVFFTYNDVKAYKVTMKVKNVSIGYFLKVAIGQKPLKYSIEGKSIYITKKTTRQTGAYTIHGKIIDESGEPLYGAAVQIKGEHEGTISDADGNFSFTTNLNDGIVRISYLGYAPLEMSLDDASRETLFKLEPNTQINDVVVTGYQTLKKFNVTGAVNTIDEKTISLRSSDGLQGILEGNVPGLTVYNDTYRIRGGASLNSGNDPLIIVDDFEVEELPENMNNVENITVLKDAAATAIWGSRAANGVIVITTKKGKKGKFNISYSNSFRISSKPDFDDLNRISSEQLVDYDREIALKGYNDMMGGFGYQGAGYSLSQEIIADYLPGYGNQMSDEDIAAMDQRLNVLKNQSNRDQIEKYLLRNSFEQLHNIAISGGENRYKYYLSGSYTNNHSEYEGDKTNTFNINSRNSYDLNKIMTLRADLSATFKKKDNGYDDLENDIYNLYPFQMLVDAEGNRVYDYSSFSHEVSDEYKAKGYYDFGSNILEELDLANNITHTNDYKVRLGADFKVWKGLNITVDYQYEKYASKTKNIKSENSVEVRRLINNFTQISDNGLEYDIPQGDVLDQTRNDVDSWVLKIGATLNRNFGARQEHYVNATAGYEMRSRHSYSERSRRLGYDDQLLSYSEINAVDLDDWRITPWGNYVSYRSSSYNSFTDVLNRERSYYLSTVYTYDRRYTLSGSLRIDEL
jgi:TonB-linked SusC/RagA family outer membrane protein